jgi:uracil phosphoribosyltransferase
MVADMARLQVVDHPVLLDTLTGMRRTDTPTPEFRRLMRRAGLLLTATATADLALRPATVVTPMGETTAPELASVPVLVSVLRAGNGLLDGARDLLPDSPVGHLGLYRNEDTLEAVTYSSSLPDLAGRLAIVLDPMLATGGTASAAVDLVVTGGPAAIRLVSLVAAPEGVERFGAAHPEVEVWTASVDSHLDDSGYIVPGLGDAGDRLYGTS